MRLIIAILIALGILWTAGMYIGLSKRDHPPECVYDPSLITEVPVKKGDRWELIPPRADFDLSKKSADIDTLEQPAGSHLNKTSTKELQQIFNGETSDAVENGQVGPPFVPGRRAR